MDSVTSALANVAANKGGIYGSLVYLRSEMTKKNGALKEFRDYGGVKILSRLLQQVNPKITSLVLSILGDYSMNPECCEEVIITTLSNKYRSLLDINMYVLTLSIVLAVT